MTRSSTVASPRFVLASKSPARLETLRSAGLDPAVVVSGVDESVVTAENPARLCALLAALKAEAVADLLVARGVDSGRMGSAPDEVAPGRGDPAAGGVAPGPAGSVPGAAPVVVLGCDSVLEFNGRAYGKPGTSAVAKQRWQQIRGGSGVLHTGHHVIVIDGGSRTASTRVASTVVRFADPTDDEIDAYVATGEPQAVAGAFTIDGYGGAYITSIEGDPHNVVGVSLPLVRMMLADLGVGWHTLWSRLGDFTE
jgi:septum formation protein